MICKKCGKENSKGVKFCAECGSELVQNKKNSASTETKKSNDFVKLLLENLNKIKNYLLKPLESIDKDSEDLKKVGITGGILVILMTLVNLIMTMINSLRSVSMDWTGKISYEISFKNLGNLDYLSLIFKNLFIYIIVILAIAGVFYIGSLVVKKEVKYAKILSIVFIADIPFFICNVVVSTILNFIYNPLAVIAMVISTIYSICIFYNLINDEIKLEGMTRIYYNVACYSAIILVIYFILVKVVLAAISSVTNMFGF